MIERFLRSVFTVSDPLIASQAGFADGPIKTHNADGISKRIFDLSVAVLIAVLFAPLIIFIFAGLLIAQGRPVIIRQTRVGLGGKTFPCFKFRTMVRDADAMLQNFIAEDPIACEEWERSRKLKNDPRITALGHALRKSSVDELPQLINIIRGDMSFVGPRPIVADEIKLYGSDIRHYYSVRPGLTGPWQISGRNDVSYAYRVALDVEYVANSSLPLDIMIIMKTLPAVLASRGSY